MTQSAQPDDEVRRTEKEYCLSRRGAYNGVHRDIWTARSKQMANLWTPENSDAPINFRLAENNLLHDDIADFIHKHLKVTPTHHLTYSTGPQGSLPLRSAISTFLNTDFKSHHPITTENIFVTPGLASAIDSIFWTLCNEGEGIIIPRPLYNGFKYDIEHRTGAVIIEAGYEGVEGYMGLDDVFDAEVTVRAFERALSRARERGIKVVAVMISNPHNPLGRCYPPTTLLAIARFCSTHHLHFISDEIYAHSVFHNPHHQNPIPFTSPLSLNLTNILNPLHHHVLYGASKDFCANGLRLGFICSRNMGLMRGMSSNAPFSWSPHVLQDIWAKMLEDETWRNDFFAKNTRLMGERYAQATGFLKEKGIRWFESYAGVFIWIDLRCFLLDDPTIHNSPIDTSAYEDLKVTSPHSTKYLAREAKLANLAIDHKVLIARGSIYSTEEYGWFRITFTMEREALMEGLKRLWEVLEVIRVEGWGDADEGELKRGDVQRIQVQDGLTEEAGCL